jgi:serine/threonine-protein phosphatase PP1 catalytic subunit
MNTKFTAFINHLLTFNNQQKLLKSVSNLRFNITATTICRLSADVSKLFIAESNILTLSAPIFIYGDIHGQYCDLIRFLEMTGLPSKSKLLFLGDYVDRGKNSIEVLALLFSLKLQYPNHIYLLRGNHECPEINANYGFLQECKDRFGTEAYAVFEAVNKCLITLPIAAVINHKIFCVHGGISPHLTNLADITKINRMTNIPNDGLLCDLLWSDPKTDKKSWNTNDRGVSYTYNEAAINTFLTTNGLDLICRAHQAIQTGYKFFNGHKLITVFSAPNYCGVHGNDGAVLKISKDLECSFLIIKPTLKDTI